MEYDYVLTTEYDGELFSTHRLSNFDNASNEWQKLKDCGNAERVATYTMTDPTGRFFTKVFFVK